MSRFHLFRIRPVTGVGLAFIAVTLLWANVHEFREYPKYINGGVSTGWPFVVEFRPDHLNDGTIQFQWSTLVLNVFASIALLAGFAIAMNQSFTGPRFQFTLLTALLAIFTSAGIIGLEMRITKTVSYSDGSNGEPPWRYEKETRGFPWVWWSKYTSTGGKHSLRWVLTPNGRSSRSQSPEYVILERGVVNNSALAILLVTGITLVPQRVLRRRNQTGHVP